MRLPRLRPLSIVIGLLLVALAVSSWPAAAAASLTITPLTWNVVGLDSNDVTVGPNTFPVGARVCNSGDTTATDVESTFVWDSTDSYIALRPGSLAAYTGSDAVSLAPGECHDFYYEVEVTRNAAAHDHTRRYHITASIGGSGTVSTSQPREIFVEHLISQNRNSITDVKLDGTSIPAGGTMALVLGQTYSIEVDGETATQGYNQIETFIHLPNTIFEVLSVQTQYSADSSPYVSNPSDKLYGDGCLWDNDPNSPTYRACTGVDGKAGGTVVVTYQIRIIGGAGTSEDLNTLIYDFSGSSYHYNSDFGVNGRVAAIVDPSTLTLSKAFTPSTTTVGGTSRLTFTIHNPNDVALSGLNFTDDLPTAAGSMTVANPPGASTSGCGTPTFAPSAGDSSIAFSDGSVAANADCTISLNVTADEVDTYNNTSGHLYIDTADTGDTASASLVVTAGPTPPAPVCSLTLAQWTFTGATDPPPQPAPSTQAADVATAAISVGGTSPGSLSDVIDTGSGSAAAPSLLTYGWPKDGPIDTATFPYLEFAIDTSQYTQVSLAFAADRKANGPDSDYVYYSTNGTTWTLKSGFSPTTSWASFGPYNFTGETSTGGVTYFRIYGYGANTTSQGQDMSLDDVTFTGCGTPDPPTLDKAFSPDPVAVGATSTLSFTITNPNLGVALSGIQFADTLPAGVTVTSGSTSVCGGTMARTAPSTLTFTGGSLAAGSSCGIPVTVTVTTAGPHTNVTGYVSSNEAGTNSTASGVASDSIAALEPPEISKQFSPNPILTGGISTLTFTIINPNPDDALTGVAFSDTLPATPGAMVVANPTGASTSGCGSPTFAPSAGATSVSFSDGMIAAGGTCSVQVDVTATATGNYDNTSGAVSATLVGAGNTASDTLTVQSLHPGVSILKRVSGASSGPWRPFVGVGVGDDVYFQMTVENTGDVPLTNVTVTDPTLSGLGVDLSGCAWASMPLYDVQTCVLGPVTAVSGSHSNTATAHGDYSSTTYDSSPSTATYATTGLSLAKSVTESSYTSAGDVLHYSYLVTNTGSAPLAGPVSVADDLSSDESCPDVSTVGDLDAFLDPGESLTCSATYTVTSGDVSNGSVTNTASATADSVTSNEDSQTVYLNLADLHVTKTDDVGGAGALGASFTWSLTVSNAGPLDAVFSDGQTILSDPLPSGATYGTPAVGSFTDVTNSSNINCSVNGSDLLTCTASGGSVTIGATSGTFTVSVASTPTSVGSLPNTATVDQGDVITELDESNNTASDTVTVTAPELSANKTDDVSGNLPASGSFIWTIDVANGSGGGVGTASFASGDVLLKDDLPTGPTYGLVSLTDGSTPPGGTGSLNCTITSGTLTCSASGGSVTLAPGASFSVAFSVTPAASGDLANPASGGACSVDPDDLIAETDESDNACSDTVSVLAPPTISKAFSPTSITVGDTSSLQFTLTNPNSGAGLSGVAFSDTLPSGVTVTSSTSSECGGTLTVTAPATIALSGGSLAAGGSCSFSVTVTGATAGAKNNTTGTVTSTEGGDGGTASDTLTVSGPPTISKAFSPASITVGDTSSLQFTLTNPNSGAGLSGVAFSDTLPSGVTVSSSTSSECGGTLTVTAPDTIALSGGNLAAGGSCSFSVTVTGATAGAKDNTTGTVTSTEGGDGGTATDTLTVSGPPTISKAFSPDAITLNGTSTLTFTLGNPASNPGSLSGIGFSDTYPSGVENATPLNTNNSCGGTLTATAGGTGVTLSGVSLASGSTCTLSIDVTGTTAGAKANTTGTVTSTEGGDGGTATDTLTVNSASVADPAVTKSVTPASAHVGDTVTFTLVVNNLGAGDATGVVVTDNVPAFLDIDSVVVSPASPVVTIAGNAISISFGTVSPTDSYTVTISTTVNSLGRPPGGTNQASVTSTSADPDPSNNTSSVNLTISTPSTPQAPATGFAPGVVTSLPNRTASTAYQAYKVMWLEIPTLNLQMGMVGVPKSQDGWDVTWLSSQAGYLEGTAFPTWNGNSVITGHVTLPSGLPGPFARLDRLHYGDQIVLRAWGQNYVYEVTENRVVTPSDPAIFHHEEASVVTLLTCQGYDEGSGAYLHRRLVRARLVRIGPIAINHIGR